LRAVLPQAGLVLEVASGSGQHIVHLARAFGHLSFQPTDHDQAALASIDAWSDQSALSNLRPALRLDAAASSWPVAQAAAILCINMVHIAPWAATQGLFRNATHILPPGGPLVLYGPFDRDGVPRAPSNAAFDADLRGRDPSWGLRHLDSLTALGDGFGKPDVIEMPANNILAVYRRHGD
jgi:SAM-dependent methyltransferase